MNKPIGSQLHWHFIFPMLKNVPPDCKSSKYSFLSYIIRIEKLNIEMEEGYSKQLFEGHEYWGSGSLDANPAQESNREGIASTKMSELIDLHRAKERFKLFASQIGHIAFAPIRNDILLYCNGQKKAEKCVEATIKPENLIKKIQLRIDKMLKTKKIKRNWGEEDMKILIWVVSKYCEFKSIQDVEKDISQEDWKVIASLIPGVNEEACMFKWLSIKKVTLASHNWTKKQSEILALIVDQRLKVCKSSEIKDWKQISQELYVLNNDEQKVYRNAKQCREHWTCYLSPQLKKGPWQLYQDVKLLRFIRDNKGNKKWSQIAKHFEGRTENALKNRYTLIIDKQKKLPRNKSKQQLELICEYLQKCYVDQFTTNIKVEYSYSIDSIESIYQEQSSVKRQQDQVPCKKEENNSSDTYQSAITPVRVQKFNINDFECMNFMFFRNITPGVIEADGTFKKISSSNAKQQNNIQKGSSQSFNLTQKECLTTMQSIFPNSPI